MLLIGITGAQIRAGRALAGLTIEDLAIRAQVCRHSVRKWEGSSNAVPSAMVDHLSRALDVLEAEGILIDYLPVLRSMLRETGRPFFVDNYKVANTFCRIGRARNSRAGPSRRTSVSAAR
jgi:transcriptional regulator with XRE-family HTH domain